jgi:2-C-methyl-D-erythritol 2,4-cyclodiphosphate synthase
MRRVTRAGFAIGNVDATLIAQEPRLAPFRTSIQEGLAKQLGIEAARVNVKLKSTDGLGALGRGEGIAAQAVVLLEHEDA